MQANIPTEKLPAEGTGPTLVHALPELHYPAQVNAAVELIQPHLDAGHGDDVAIYFEDEAITYAELEARTNRLGNVLRDLGVGPGDRVFVRFPNRPEYIVACLAVQKIGAISLPR